MKTRYLLTSAEQRKLKQVASYTGLKFEALAARPDAARRMIALHHAAAVERSKLSGV